MTEFEETVALANKVLDRPSADPDDDLAMLSRQFLRQVERLDHARKAVIGSPLTADMLTHIAAAYAAQRKHLDHGDAALTPAHISDVNCLLDEVQRLRKAIGEASAR